MTQRPTSHGKPRHILVIEDNLVNQKLALKLLQGHSQMVKGVSSGEAALTQADCNTYDFILLDCGLPDMSGLDVVRHLRRQGCHAWVVGITGNPQQWPGPACLAAGMNDYAVKPLTPQLIQHILTRYANN